MEGDLLAAIARWGLQGPDRTAAVPLADEPLADEPFGDLVLGCESHRLVGFLGAAVAEGGLPVTAGQRERIEQIVQSWMAAVVRLEGMAVRAIRVPSRR